MEEVGEEEVESLRAKWARELESQVAEQAMRKQLRTLGEVTKYDEQVPMCSLCWLLWAIPSIGGAGTWADLGAFCGSVRQC